MSQKAVSFIHDVLTEVLASWAELPHFHFNEALFRPLEHIMQLELCDEDVQDQVILMGFNGSDVILTSAGPGLGVRLL